MPSAKITPASAVQSVSFKTASEGVIYYLEQMLKKGEQFQSHNWEVLFDDLQLKKRLGLLLNLQPSWPKENCGPHALAFIQFCEEGGEKEFGPKLSSEKLLVMQKHLSDLNLDLTQEPIWQTYWEELFNQCKLGALFQDTDLLRNALSTAQNQILAAYQLVVISHCYLVKREVEKNESETEHELKQIPGREFLQSISCYLCIYPIEKVNDKIKHYCLENIKEQLANEISNEQYHLKKGELLATMRSAKRCLLRLTFSLPFELLTTDDLAPPLLEVTQKLTAYENLVQGILNAMDDICTKAIPGLQIESEIHHQIKIMKQANLFQKVQDVGPLCIIKLLHHPEYVRSIHEKIIATRALYCKPLLQDAENNFAALRSELRKITVYRVRRHLIARLFDMLIEEKLTNEIDEECLVALQEEYLQAVSRQLEKMSFEEAKAFIAIIKKKKILQPMPSAKALRLKGDSAQKELVIILNLVNETNTDNVHAAPTESTPLHDIDSPIELDILGEMTRQLTTLLSSHGTMILEEHDTIMSIVENTYHILGASDYQPTPLLSELIVDENYHEKVKERLLSESDLAYRREKISALFEVVKEVDKFKDKSLFFWNKSSRTQMLAMHLLLTLYIDTLKLELQETKLSFQRDKYVVYQMLLKEALHSALLQWARVHKKTQPYYQECVALLEALYVKEVSKLPSIVN